MTTAIILSAVIEIVAVIIAAAFASWRIILKINERRKLEKETNSIKVMLTLCSDKDLYAASRIVSEIEDDPDDSSEKYAHPIPNNLNNTAKELWLKKRSALRALVNFFETVSVGILRDIYDEAIVFDCARAMFVKNYERTEMFIEKTRKDTNTHSYGANFECIAKRFAAKPPSKPK